MKASAAERRRKSRWVLWLLGGIAVALAAALTFISKQIVHDADLQELHPADAIVVFGAAEYAGRPSPVYRARLDHAFDLYRQGLASVVITTGGSGGDLSYNEGQVGHDYLMHRGVPEDHLIAETQGTDTAQSAERVAVIMRANRMLNCLAVSDEYHVFRIRRLLQHEGLQVHVAPRSDSRPRTSFLRALAVLREATSYLLWRLNIPT
jgi:uncharacterized SAM-binding protein YcdF (DUF218 family)